MPSPRACRAHGRPSRRRGELAQRRPEPSAAEVPAPRGGASRSDDALLPLARGRISGARRRAPALRICGSPAQGMTGRPPPGGWVPQRDRERKEAVSPGKRRVPFPPCALDGSLDRAFDIQARAAPTAWRRAHLGGRATRDARIVGKMRLLGAEARRAVGLDPSPRAKPKPPRRGCSPARVARRRCWPTSRPATPHSQRTIEISRSKAIRAYQRIPSVERGSCPRLATCRRATAWPAGSPASSA
jgi:hypothetical protein